MRYFILALALLSLSAHAKDHIVITEEVHCFTPKVAFDQLKNKFGEEAIFIGKSSLENGVVVMVYVNQQTGTYTVLQAGQDIVCVLDTGKDMRYRMPKALENKLM